MDKFKIGTLEYAPYNNHNKEHLFFLRDLLEEIEEEGELEKRMGDIEYMFSHSYKELNSFQVDNPNAYLVYDKNNIVGFVYMYVNKEQELLLYLGIHKDFRNRGYSSRINQELPLYLLNNFPIKGIRVQVEKDNIPSVKAITKAGFVPIGDDFYIKRL